MTFSLLSCRTCCGITLHGLLQQFLAVVCAASLVGLVAYVAALEVIGTCASIVHAELARAGVELADDGRMFFITVFVIDNHAHELRQFGRTNRVSTDRTRLLQILLDEVSAQRANPSTFTNLHEIAHIDVIFFGFACRKAVGVTSFRITILFFS